MAKDLELALRIRADLGAARQEIAALRGDVQKLGGAGSAAAPGLDRSNQQIGRMQRSASGLSGTLRQLRGALAVLGVGVLVREAAQAGLALERMERGLLAATGSAEGAGAAMAFVRSESQRLGLDLASAGAQFAALSAAARGTALEGAGARDIFSAVAEASVVMGLSADQTAGALTAIQQIISKGTVSAEELRGQLGERLPGAFQIAARAMGVTTAELGNMLQAGEVAAEQMLPRFAAELRKTFGAALPDAINSSQAAINRFRTQVFEAQAAFARSGFLDGLTEGLAGFSTALNDPQVRDGLAALGQGLGNLIALAGRAIANFRELAPLIGTLGGAFTGGRVGAAIGRPFGPGVAAVTGGIGLLAGAVGGNLKGRDIRGQPAAPGTGLIERRPPATAPAAPLPPLLPPAGGGGKTGASEADQRAKAIASVIAALREEADTFGLTAEQAQVYRLSVMGATDAQIEQAMALASQITGLRDKAAADKAAAEAQKQRAQESARLADADREVSEALAEELHLITLGGRERAQEEAARRLSAKATDEQRRAVEALAGALYDQQQAAKDTGDQMSEFAVQAAHNMQSAFADFLFDPFSQGLQGMLSGFVDVLRRMASEALAAKLGEALFGDLLKGGAAAAGGGAGGGSGLIGGLLAGLFHAGGVVGSAGGATRNMPALAFAAAPRLHAGGLAGLAADEMPAILRRNEEVLTRDDPRHRFNGGIASAPPQVTVRNVNLFDTQVIGDYLSTSAGEKVVLNVVSRNKAALGIS